MDWIKSINTAINYIESNITEEMNINEIASKAYISPFYFQKGFMMLCGYSVSDYIKYRRLSLAGSEVISSDAKIIDIAIKYGYDSPDSFTKAFTRFHGATPTAIRKDGKAIKTFSALKIKFSLIGGYSMNYKIVEKEGFAVVGFSKRVSLESSAKDIPQMWTEHYQTGKGEFICGKYGVCIDESNMTSGEFDYMIADDYDSAKTYPKECVVKEFPKLTWAVFSCVGAMPKSLQDVNREIFSEWLPNCNEYEIAVPYNIEMYTDIKDYPKGNQDEKYYSEIWIPVKKK